MENVYARARLTHKYVDDYKHLDRRRLIGVVRLTPPKMVREPEDFDDGGQYVRFGRLPANLNRRERVALANAVEDTLGHWGCAHEYDCCGCELVRANAEVHGRHLRVTLSVGYNY